MELLTVGLNHFPTATFLSLSELNSTDRGGEHAPPEPDGVPLHLMGDDVHLDRFGLKQELYSEARRLMLTVCPVRFAVASSRVFTFFLISRSSRLPKSWEINSHEYLTILINPEFVDLRTSQATLIRRTDLQIETRL